MQAGTSAVEGGPDADATSHERVITRGFSFSSPPDRLSAPAVPAPLSVGQVALLACGPGHVLAVSRDGAAWAWGGNRDGQLGTGVPGPGTDRPARVVAREPFAWAAAGFAHSVFVTAGGGVLACGANGFKQCGGAEGVADAITTPRPVPGLRGIGGVDPQTGAGAGAARAVAAARWSVVVCRLGGLYAWGCFPGGPGGEVDLVPVASATGLGRGRAVGSAAAEGPLAGCVASEDTRLVPIPQGLSVLDAWCPDGRRLVVLVERDGAREPPGLFEVVPTAAGDSRSTQPRRVTGIEDV